MNFSWNLIFEHFLLKSISNGSVCYSCPKIRRTFEWNQNFGQQTHRNFLKKLNFYEFIQILGVLGCELKKEIEILGFQSEIYDMESQSTKNFRNLLTEIKTCLQLLFNLLKENPSLKESFECDIIKLHNSFLEVLKRIQNFEKSYFFK